MDLYIGNGTKQILQFEFRLKGSGKVSRRIGPGQQTGFRDLKPEQVDEIIAQHERYGMIPADKVRDATAKTDYIYQIDKPINPSILDELDKRNSGVLIIRGREIRKQLAVAIDKNVQNDLQRQNRDEQLRGFDLQVIEKQPEGGYRTDIAQPVAERIEVDHSPPGQADVR